MSEVKAAGYYTSNSCNWGGTWPPDPSANKTVIMDEKGNPQLVRAIDSETRFPISANRHLSDRNCIETLLSSIPQIPIVPRTNPIAEFPASNIILAEVKDFKGKLAGYIDGYGNLYAKKGDVIARAKAHPPSNTIYPLYSPKKRLIGYLRDNAILNLNRAPIASFDQRALKVPTNNTIFGKIKNGKLIAIEGDPLESFWKLKGIIKPPVLPDPQGKLPAKRIVIHQGEYGIAPKGATEALATYSVGACVIPSFYDPVSGTGILGHIDYYHSGTVKDFTNKIINYFLSQKVPLSRLKVQITGGQKYDLTSRKIVYALISELSRNGITVEGAGLFSNGYLPSVWLDLSSGDLKYSLEKLRLTESEQAYEKKYWEQIKRSSPLHLNKM